MNYHNLSRICDSVSDAVHDKSALDEKPLDPVQFKGDLTSAVKSVRKSSGNKSIEIVECNHNNFTLSGLGSDEGEAIENLLRAKGWKVYLNRLRDVSWYDVSSSQTFNTPADLEETLAKDVDPLVDELPPISDDANVCDYPSFTIQHKSDGSAVLGLMDTPSKGKEQILKGLSSKGWKLSLNYTESSYEYDFFN